MSFEAEVVVVNEQPLGGGGPGVEVGVFDAKLIGELGGEVVVVEDWPAVDGENLGKDGDGRGIGVGSGVGGPADVAGG